jgi:hypothetical protein
MFNGELPFEEEYGYWDDYCDSGDDDADGEIYGDDENMYRGNEDDDDDYEFEELHRREW